MINNGVPHHFVQRFLGHESPEMTSHYAHIFDKTLKEAFKEFEGKLVNISGDVIRLETSEDVSDALWFKRHMLAQTLPNGYCSIPVVAGPCPHANACLTCTHFRTDKHFLVAIGRDLRLFPRPKRRRRVSPHAAFQLSLGTWSGAVNG